jgi:hypothetical protein
MRLWPEKPCSNLHSLTQKCDCGLKSPLQNCIFRHKNAIMVLKSLFQNCILRRKNAIWPQKRFDAKEAEGETTETTEMRKRTPILSCVVPQRVDQQLSITVATVQNLPSQKG